MYAFLFWLAFLSHNIHALPEGFDPSCQTHHTQGYGYRLFFHLPSSSLLKTGTVQFNFSLIGPSNGHVLLAETPNSYPGYEIAIGAGGNTFSELRKYESSKLLVKANQMTPGILSTEEMKNFSISVNKGLIVLTSFVNNTEKIILSWQDTEPLDLKYVSFCAWTGITVSWYYDCKGAKPMYPELSSSRRLKSIILKGYDPYSIPVQQNSSLIVNTSIELHHVNLDAKRSLLLTHGKFNISWHDFRIKWNPMDYENISTITLLHREIWLPEFILHNAVNEGSSPMGKAIIKIHHTGIVSWNPIAEMKTRCNLDLKDWPFDKHLCNIDLGLFPYPDSVCVSIVGEIKPDLTWKSSEWLLQSVRGKTGTIATLWDMKNETVNHRAILLSIEVERESTFYIYAYYIPIIGSLAIVLSSFLFSVLGNKRLLLHSTCLFLLIFDLLALNYALPALTSSAPHIVSVCCSLLILSTMHIIFLSFIASSCILKQLISSRLVYRIAINPIAQSLLCTFGTYHTMEEESILPVNIISPAESCTNETLQPHHSMLFIIMLDRLFCTLCTLYIGVILVF